MREYNIEDTVAVFCALVGGIMVIFGDAETWTWKTFSLVGFLAVLMVTCMVISIVRRKAERR